MMQDMVPFHSQNGLSTTVALQDSVVSVNDFFHKPLRLNQRGDLVDCHRNQSIMGGIRRGASYLSYPTAPPLAVPLRESPCRLPSHIE